MSAIKRIQNIPAFDGFRGIGVFIVVMTHMPMAADSRLYNAVWEAVTQTRLGYIALDIFFTISGFFITRLLLAERDRTGSISLSKFYKRRALRIFPIYYLTVFACYFIFQFDAVDTFSLATYTFNFYHPFHPDPQPLEHCWSLSVEEQFYLIWPFLMMVLPQRWIPVVTGCVVPVSAIVSGLVISAWVGSGDQLLAGNLVYMLPVTRMLSISIGAWLAVREFEGKPFHGAVCAGFVIVAVLALSLMRVGRGEGLIASQGLYWTMAIVCYAMLSIAFCASIIFGEGRSAMVLRAILCFAPLRSLGRISYGVYLYHLPVLFYLGLNDAAVAGGAVPFARLGLASAIILALGITSYFAVEQPLLSLGKPSKPRDTAPARVSSVLDG